jgi:predicted 3-demethylubiquinone-9 3-methyltransferase (glyoxalase superfamily)
MPKVTPNLWFDGNAEEAAQYYCSVFPNSKILTVTHYGDFAGDRAGDVLTVEFELDGTRFVGINAGPEFHFDEAVSFEIDCKDQAEIDHYWDTFVGDGGEEGQCGWCKDKFGLSWQVVHADWAELLQDPERGNRAMQAVMGMKKIDMAAIYKAADG